MEDDDKTRLMVTIQSSSNPGSIQDLSDDCSSASQSPIPTASGFCTISNFQSAVVYLSQELQNLGLQYKLIEANGDKLNLVALVNSFWSVIQLYHGSIKDGNMLHDSRRRDIADISHLQGSMRDLKLMMEEKERHLQEAEERERQANCLNKAIASKLKSEKEEVRRLNSILQQREAQSQHENKKRELELNKMKDRLLRLVSGEKGSQGRSSVLSMSGCLNRSADRARGRWRTDNTCVQHEEQLYRRVMSQYESWVGQLTEEGEAIKECLFNTCSRISKLSSKCAKSETQSAAQTQDFLDESLACSVLSSDSLEDETLFSLNFLSVKERIQKNLDDNLLFIAQCLEKKNDSKNDKDNLEVNKSFEETLTSVTQGLCVEKEAQLGEQMKCLTKLRRSLQKEREAFAAAAVRLNKEKAAFEAEKVELLRHQFLEELPSPFACNSKDPFTPNTSFESSLSQSLCDLYGDSPRNVPAIPNLTSPTGDVIHTQRPVTLGPTALQSRRETQGSGTPRSVGGRSEPATRNPSLSRSVDLRLLHEESRPRTLERPSRATFSSFGTDKEGVMSPARTLSRLGKRPCQSPLPAASHTPGALSHPSAAEGKRSLSNRLSGEASFLRQVSMPDGASSEDCLSGDSGFYFVQDGESHPATLSQNAQTNCRLNALESSLANILDQINAKEVHPRPREDCSSPCVNDEPKIYPSLLKNLKSSLVNYPQKASPLGPQGTFSASGPTPCNSSVRLEARKPSRMGSAPGSLGTSRKSSRDRRPEDDYLKRIQDNISKWYWK